MMKGALLYGVNDVRLVEVEKPSVEPGDVLVKVKVCGVCPTDVRKYKTGNHGVPKLPFNMGHEWAGDILEVGDMVNGFEVGMRVGGANCGGYAEYIVTEAEFNKFAPYPEMLLMPIPTGVSYDAATFLEPLADCFHAVVTQAQVHVADTLLIIGAGQMGLLLLSAGKNVGARVIVTDMLEERLDFARQFGADISINAREESLKDRMKEITKGKGFDAVITAVGQPLAIAQAMDVVRKRGRVVIFGGTSEGTTVQIDPNKIHYNEVTLVASSWLGAGGFLDAKMCHVALEMIRSGKIPVERLITHKFRLERIHEAFKVVENLQGLKSLIMLP
jgi:L-iditol 2-dehydrogenase